MDKNRNIACTPCLRVDSTDRSEQMVFAFNVVPARRRIVAYTHRFVWGMRFGTVVGCDVGGDVVSTLLLAKSQVTI